MSSLLLSRLPHLNSLIYADVPLINYLLTFAIIIIIGTINRQNSRHSFSTLIHRVNCSKIKTIIYYLVEII